MSKYIHKYIKPTYIHTPLQTLAYTRTHAHHCTENEFFIKDFTVEILNVKLHFLCSACIYIIYTHIHT